MSETASHLRQTIAEIDRQLLAMLVPHGGLTAEAMAKVALLEHARTAAERLLQAAEGAAPANKA